MKYAHLLRRATNEAANAIFVQQLLWCGAQAVGMVIGNHELMAKTNKKVLNVEAPRSSEEIVDPSRSRRGERRSR